MKKEEKNTKLSKTLLDMKFMKKTRDRVEKEADDAEGQAMYSHEVSEKMRKSGNIIFVEASISQCKDLIDGHLSFGGMNPAIEKIMSNNHYKKLEEDRIDRKKEQDISDVELAKGYSTLISTMGNKFKAKQNRKFMEPNVLLE